MRNIYIFVGFMGKNKLHEFSWKLMTKNIENDVQSNDFLRVIFMN